MWLKSRFAKFIVVLKNRWEKYFKDQLDHQLFALEKNRRVYQIWIIIVPFDLWTQEFAYSLPTPPPTLLMICIIVSCPGIGMFEKWLWYQGRWAALISDSLQTQTFVGHYL